MTEEAPSEDKQLPASGKVPLLPEDDQLSIDEIRQELFRIHDFVVDRDDPALMYVTIMKACLREQRNLMNAHLNSLSSVMASETGKNIEATSNNVKSLQDTLSKLTTDGIQNAASGMTAVMASLQSTIKLCTAVMAVSALLIVGVFVLKAMGVGI